MYIRGAALRGAWRQARQTIRAHPPSGRASSPKHAVPLATSLLAVLFVGVRESRPVANKLQSRRQLTRTSWRGPSCSETPPRATALVATPTILLIFTYLIKEYSCTLMQFRDHSCQNQASV